MENEKYCPCTIGTIITIPSFIGNDYFCETESPLVQPKQSYSDALWDGKNVDHFKSHVVRYLVYLGFIKHYLTDYIELCMCANYDDEDTPIGFYDIYVK